MTVEDIFDIDEVKFERNKSKEFATLGKYDPDTIYFCTNPGSTSGEIVMGGVSYGGGSAGGASWEDFREVGEFNESSIYQTGNVVTVTSPDGLTITRYVCISGYNPADEDLITIRQNPRYADIIIPGSQLPTKITINDHVIDGRRWNKFSEFIIPKAKEETPHFVSCTMSAFRQLVNSSNLIEGTIYKITGYMNPAVNTDNNRCTLYNASTGNFTIPKSTTIRTSRTIYVKAISDELLEDECIYVKDDYKYNAKFTLNPTEDSRSVVKTIYDNYKHVLNFTNNNYNCGLVYDIKLPDGGTLPIDIFDYKFLRIPYTPMILITPSVGTSVQIGARLGDLNKWWERYNITTPSDALDNLTTIGDVHMANDFFGRQWANAWVNAMGSGSTPWNFVDNTQADNGAIKYEHQSRAEVYRAVSSLSSIGSTWATMTSIEASYSDKTTRFAAADATAGTVGATSIDFNLAVYDQLIFNAMPTFMAHPDKVKPGSQISQSKNWSIYEYDMLYHRYILRYIYQDNELPCSIGQVLIKYLSTTSKIDKLGFELQSNNSLFNTITRYPQISNFVNITSNIYAPVMVEDRALRTGNEYRYGIFNTLQPTLSSYCQTAIRPSQEYGINTSSNYDDITRILSDAESCLYLNIHSVSHYSAKETSPFRKERTAWMTPYAEDSINSLGNTLAFSNSMMSLSVDYMAGVNCDLGSFIWDNVFFNTVTGISTDADGNSTVIGTRTTNNLNILGECVGNTGGVFKDTTIKNCKNNVFQSIENCVIKDVTSSQLTFLDKDNISNSNNIWLNGIHESSFVNCSYVNIPTTFGNSIWAHAAGTSYSIEEIGLDSPRLCYLDSNGPSLKATVSGYNPDKFLSTNNSFSNCMSLYLYDGLVKGCNMSNIYGILSANKAGNEKGPIFGTNPASDTASSRIRLGALCETTYKPYMDVANDYYNLRYDYLIGYNNLISPIFGTNSDTITTNMYKSVCANGGLRNACINLPIERNINNVIIGRLDELATPSTESDSDYNLLKSYRVNKTYEPNCFHDLIIDNVNPPYLDETIEQPAFNYDSLHIKSNESLHSYDMIYGAEGNEDYGYKYYIDEYGNAMSYKVSLTDYFVKSNSIDANITTLRNGYINYSSANELNFDSAHYNKSALKIEVLEQYPPKMTENAWDTHKSYVGSQYGQYSGLNQEINIPMDFNTYAIPMINSASSSDSEASAWAFSNNPTWTKNILFAHWEFKANDRWYILNDPHSLYSGLLTYSSFRGSLGVGTGSVFKENGILTGIIKNQNNTTTNIRRVYKVFDAIQKFNFKATTGSSYTSYTQSNYSLLIYYKNNSIDTRHGFQSSLGYPSQDNDSAFVNLHTGNLPRYIAFAFGANPTDMQNKTIRFFLLLNDVVCLYKGNIDRNADEWSIEIDTSRPIEEQFELNGLSLDKRGTAIRNQFVNGLNVIAHISEGDGFNSEW